MKIVYSKLKDMYLLAPSEDLFPCNVNKCLQWSCFEWVPCHLVFLWKENLCNYCEVLRGGARVMIEQGCTTCGSLAARKWRDNEKMKRTWRENEEMEKYSLSIFFHNFLSLYPFPASKIVSFCRKMLNTALLSRMSQKHRKNCECCPGHSLTVSQPSKLLSL